MKSFRDIRVIPVVLVAIFGLAVLKVAGLVIDGGYVFDYQPQKTTRSWAQETLNFPGSKIDPADVTGSTPKPKDAARVFDRLEMSVLFEIASQIAPRKMSDILGLMAPEAAERLTVELARRAGSDKSVSAADLPKIEGKALPQNRN